MTGDASLRSRPMRRVIDPLTACGARFTAREGGRLPLAIKGAREALPLEYRVPVPSAQVKSAVLLCGLNAPGITRVEEPEATRDHSENMLRHFGATVQVETVGRGRVITLHGQPELPRADVVVPGDPSSAAFPLAAALLVPGSRLTLPGVGLNPLRTGLLATLAEMGADIVVENRRIRGRRAGRRPGRHARPAARGRRAAGARAQHDRRIPDPGGARRRRRRGHHAHARAGGTAGEGERPPGRHRRAAAVNGVRVEIEGDDLLVHGTGRPPAGGGDGGNPHGPPHRDERAGAGPGDRAAGERWTMPASSTPVSRVSSR